MKAARILACLALAALAGISAEIVAQQPGTAPSELPPPTDPLTKELERCKALHEKAVNDEGCQAASKEVTRRFFQPPPEYHPVPIQMDPDVPQPKLVKPDQPPGR
ncbi:MAG: putative entry exclusion protein TrbK-alt [Aliidongia sp.]